jgi:peroxiredoxin
MNLNDRPREYRARQEAGDVPSITSDHLEAIYRHARRLADSGAAGRVLRAGDTFPEFALPNENGVTVTSAELLERGPLAVVFHRGAWCDYCNFTLEALEEVYPRIRELGAELVAVSPVTMPHLRAAIRHNQISYPILSDAGNAYAARFGLSYVMDHELLGVRAGFGMDFTRINGDDSATMPMPGVLLTGTDRLLRFAQAHPLHWERPEPADLVAAIEALREETCT